MNLKIFQTLRDKLLEHKIGKDYDRLWNVIQSIIKYQGAYVMRNYSSVDPRYDDIDCGVSGALLTIFKTLSNQIDWLSRNFKMENENFKKIGLNYLPQVRVILYKIEEACEKPW